MDGHPRPDGDEARPAARAVRVTGVVLGAGRATRMGGSKLLRPVGGQPMVARVVDAALASGLAETVVVVGHEADEVRDVLRGRAVRVVLNPDFADGMSTSMRAGLRAVGPGCDAVMFVLADQPFVTAALLDLLIGEYAASGKAVVRPEVRGRPAHPVVVGAALFPELLAESGDRGGRRVIERHAADLRLVAVEDARLCIDIDSPEEYERVRQG